MKIGIISDLHLGRRNYGIIALENDFYTQYQKTIKELIKQKVDTVIIAGDIFDTPKVSPLAIEQFQEGIRQLNNKNINVLNIIGNHTMLQTKQHLPADKLFEKEFTYKILDKNYQYKEDKTIIAGLPYHNNTQIEELKAKIEILADKMSSALTKILVLHQEFQEYCGFAGAKLSIKDLPLEKFDIIICGHIHQRLDDYNTQTETLYIQPGSIERLNKAEAQDEQDTGKGITIIDTNANRVDKLKNTYKFINIPPVRPYIIKDYTWKDISKKEITEILNDLLLEVKSCNMQPVVFIEIKDNTNSYDLITDKIKEIDTNSLTCRFTYYDIGVQDYNSLSFNDGKIPSVEQALKEAVQDDERAEDIVNFYEAANNPDEDLKGVVDSLFKKLYPPVEVEPIYDPKFEELKAYFLGDE